MNGSPDGQEVIAGTDVFDPDSFFALQAPQPTDATTMTLQWPSVADRYYRLHFTPTMDQPFQNPSSWLPATPPQNSFPSELTETTQGYWQVEVRLGPPDA